MLVIVGHFLLIAMTAPDGDALAQTRLSYRVGFEEIKFPTKKELNRVYRHTLSRFGKQIKQRDLDGNEAFCSKQILREAHWLVNYTPYADRIERRLADLRDSLEQMDQSFASKQIPEDGSWGACYDEWYLRLSASVDPLKELNLRGKRPQYALRFLERIDTPEELTMTLEGMLPSR